MKLDALISGLDGVRVEFGSPDQIEINGVTDDSRDVGPGSLFIARPGVKQDGRRWIEDAIAFHAAAILTDGAGVETARSAASAQRKTPAVLRAEGDLRTLTATLAERFHGEPGKRMKLIGVTGSNGKTTVAWLTRQLCAQAGVSCGLISTIETVVGEERRQAAMTTPPAPAISALLARMLESGDGACAMEVSSHALDQSRTAALEFDVAVFTNLTGDHLDYHGDMDAYARAKARLFASLAPTALAVVNADDPMHGLMLKSCQAEVCRCSGGDGDATVRLRDATIEGCELALAGPWGTIDSHVPLIGVHNAMNVLQAAAAAHRLGADRAAIERALPGLTAPPGRLERVPGTADGSSPAVIVDYAHSDDAIEKTLTALRPLVPEGGRLRLVFGCGGDRDTTKRPRMGAVAAGLADVCYVTSDNPRTEPPSAIIEQILGGFPDEVRQDCARCIPIVQRREAIEQSVRDASPADVICIAGKGHERVQILPDGRGGTVRLPFHDATVAAECLRTLTGEATP